MARVVNEAGCEHALCLQCERGVFVVHTQGVGEGAGVEPKGAVAGDNITIPRAVWTSAQKINKISEIYANTRPNPKP